VTGEQSRQLKVGDRVRWDQKKITDLGTIVEVTWSGVTIRWDDDHAEWIAHNDMTKIERALTFLEGRNLWRGPLDRPAPPRRDGPVRRRELGDPTAECLRT
jgi:hypothetical protein